MPNIVLLGASFLGRASIRPPYLVNLAFIATGIAERIPGLTITRLSLIPCKTNQNCSKILLAPICMLHSSKEIILVE
uniref:Uncharacterized protein MANES_12G084400 n=1 Tax=Rhizophora mucronata TaxID=61149 RepID=A0A2P2LYW2_RHIMU